MVVLSDEDGKYVVEGFVKKLFHNPRKAPTKEGMDYWQALILNDDTRIHYYGHVLVLEGQYVRAEMARPKTGEYPRCNSLQILAPPEEPVSPTNSVDEINSSEPYFPEESGKSSKPRFSYHPYEKAKMRMNAGALAKSMHESAVLSAKRNEDGSLNPDSYKEYLSLFGRETRKLWKELSGFNYGDEEE